MTIFVSVQTLSFCFGQKLPFTLCRTRVANGAAKFSFSKRSFWGEFCGAAGLFFGDVKTSDGELVWAAYWRAATFKQNVAAMTGAVLRLYIIYIMLLVWRGVEAWSEAKFSA